MKISCSDTQNKNLTITRGIFVTIPLLFLLIGGCAHRTIDEFFIDNNVLQYYIRAAKFSYKHIKASIDFTYRNYEDSNTMVRCNFTIFNTLKNIKQIDNAYFMIDDTTRVETDSIVQMFAERAYTRIRYTSRIPVDGFKKLIYGDDVTFVLNDSIPLKAKKVFYRRMDDASEIITFPKEQSQSPHTL